MHMYVLMSLTINIHKRQLYEITIQTIWKKYFSYSLHAVSNYGLFPLYFYSLLPLHRYNIFIYLFWIFYFYWIMLIVFHCICFICFFPLQVHIRIWLAAFRYFGKYCPTINVHTAATANRFIFSLKYKNKHGCGLSRHRESIL